MGLFAEFFGATLGALFFGSVVYGLIKLVLGRIVKKPIQTWASSMTLTSILLMLVAAEGYSNGGPLNWTAAIMYLPGLSLVAFAFFKRDVVPLQRNDANKSSEE